MSNKKTSVAFACCALVLAVPLAGCGVLASNGIDYSTYPIPHLPAPTTTTVQPPPCELPEPGKPITLEGCKLGDTLVLHGVNFEFDKAALTVNAKALLDPVADSLLKRTDIKIEIDGHTDGKGSDAYNLKLSDHRAASVKAYLVSRGVDAARMSSRGFGESVPIADNATDEGRALNRRVELKVVESAAVANSPPPVTTTQDARVVILEPMAAHQAEPGAGIPTAIGVLTHVPNPVEAGPTPEYKNAVGASPTPLKAGPGWENHTGGPTYNDAPAATAPAPSAPATTPAPASTAPATVMSGSNTVAISNFTFVPTTLIVAPGTTVTWTNKDNVFHVIKFADQSSASLATGASYSRTFSKPGEFAYQCGIHASMAGKIVVAKSGG